MLNRINNFFNIISKESSKPLLFNTELNLIDEDLIYIKRPPKPFLTLNINRPQRCQILQEIQYLYKSISSILHRNKLGLLVINENTTIINIFIVKLSSPNKKELKEKDWIKVKLSTNKL